MSESDERRNTRVSYKNNSFLVLNGREYQNCKTENLSLQGVFLPDLSGPVEGETGSLKIVLDRCAKIVIKAKVSVIRVEDGGVALEFTALDSDSEFHLKRVVMYNSGDPDAVTEEILRNSFRDN